MANENRSWKVGELARETGLTVRTLHHYEQKGLVRPSARSEANYRLYAEALATGGSPTREFIDTMEVISKLDSHFTPEQQSDLAARAEALGPEGMRKAEQDWADLIAEVRAELDAGTPTDSPRLAPLAERWRALVRAFTGGDLGIAKGLAQRYKDEGWERPSRGMLDSRVMEYMAEAMQHQGDI